MSLICSPSNPLCSQPAQAQQTIGSSDCISDQNKRENIWDLSLCFNVHGIYPQCNVMLSIAYGDSYVKEESLCHTKRTSFSGGSTPLTHLTLMDLFCESVYSM